MEVSALGVVIREAKFLNYNLQFYILLKNFNPQLLK